MYAKTVAIVAVVAGSLLAAGAAEARDWDRGGSGRPHWQPPAHAHQFGAREAWFGDRDRHRSRWRDDDWGRRGQWREPRGHHYGWYRDHHRRHHDRPNRSRRWWD